MTDDSSGLRTISTVVAVLLAIPLFAMGVVMPLMAVTHGGQIMGGAGGLQILVPLIPLTLLSVLAYVLYVYTGPSNESRRRTDSTLEELRSAYARGELSDEEFENRRDRLWSRPSDTEGREVSRRE